MKKLPTVLVNYCYTPIWLEDYPDFENRIYDRSDDGVERDLVKYGEVYKTENRGNVDYDKLSWLVENYHDLPDIFLWSKTNIFKYCDKMTLDRALKSNVFTPLIRPDHNTYSDRAGVVCFYGQGWYWERADNWLFHNPELALSGRFLGWEQWCQTFHLPVTKYIPFAPGGSFLLTKEKVQKFGVDFYTEMRDTLPYAQLPVEAHLAERSYGLMWGDMQL